MARMKFLCDADRCIECNACVTACKNENEVPWGINRRRVVTINDGKPGERSVSMACMHCTDAPCAAVCPVSCIFSTDDGVVLHSKDLCIGCGYCFYACPFGAPQYPKVSNFGSRGKMDKCTYCAGGGGSEVPGSIEEYKKYGANRMLRRQAAAVRRDVLDQVAAGRRWRDHRPNLQGARDQARLRLRRLGLDDRLSRGDRGVSATRTRRSRRVANRHDGGVDHDRSLGARTFRLCGASRSAGLIAFAAPVLAQQSGAPINPEARASSMNRLCFDNLRALKGESTSPTSGRASSFSPPGGPGITFTRSHCAGSARSSIVGTRRRAGSGLFRPRTAPHRGGTIGTQGAALQAPSSGSRIGSPRSRSSFSALPG